MSHKTSNDNDSQGRRTAKTRDLIGFTTADKLLDISPTDDIEVTRKRKSHLTTTSQPSRDGHTTKSPPTPASTNSKKPQNTSKKNTTTANNREQPRDTPPPQVSRLSIVEHLKSGLSLSQIAAKLGVTSSTIGYYVKRLKKEGVVKQVGYGTWEVIDTPEIQKKTTARPPYEGKKQARGEIQKNILEYIPESIRGHGFTWTVGVPQNMRNWSNKKRVQYLTHHDIPYKALGIFGGGQRLIIKGHKVWLTNKSIVIYDTDSYFGVTATDAKSTAVHSLISIIRNLERLLHTDFTIGKSWKFKPSRHHYAIIKNALAQQYDEDGLKLEVRTSEDNSLWLWIDNSYQMHETETGHHVTAEADSLNIQKFLNSVRDTKVDLHDVLEMNHGLQQLYAGLQQIQATSIVDQAAFASDLRTHVEVQKATLSLLTQVGSGINDLTAATKELSKTVKNNNG